MFSIATLGVLLSIPGMLAMGFTREFSLLIAAAIQCLLSYKATGCKRYGAFFIGLILIAGLPHFVSWMAPVLQFEEGLLWICGGTLFLAVIGGFCGFGRKKEPPGHIE